MLDNVTLHDFWLAVLHYASPLLMLLGIAGFVTCMALWALRR